ncbi:MAG: hypothetical protein SCM11_12355 [Bacillota bacterium]|nr:hypothetical protein [Bacillota bacterium]
MFRRIAFFIVLLASAFIFLICLSSPVAAEATPPTLSVDVTEHYVD